MKKETKLKVGLVLATAVVLVGAVLVWRAPALWSCMKDEYNLKRDTHFSLLFGRCTVDTPKGRVYVDTLRGFDNADNDHSN